MCVSVSSGPRQRDTYYSICAKHPNNDWCVSHGYGGILRAAEHEIKESDYFPLLVLALLTVLGPPSSVCNSEAFPSAPMTITEG